MIWVYLAALFLGGIIHAARRTPKRRSHATREHSSRISMPDSLPATAVVATDPYSPPEEEALESLCAYAHRRPDRITDYYPHRITRREARVMAMLQRD